MHGPGGRRARRGRRRAGPLLPRHALSQQAGDEARRPAACAARLDGRAGLRGRLGVHQPAAAGRRRRAHPSGEYPHAPQPLRRRPPVRPPARAQLRPQRRAVAHRAELRRRLRRPVRGARLAPSRPRHAAGAAAGRQAAHAGLRRPRRGAAHHRRRVRPCAGECDRRRGALHTAPRAARADSAALHRRGDRAGHLAGC